MNFDWRELVAAMAKKRDAFQGECFQSAPESHGEAMRRHGVAQGHNEQIDVVRQFFTEREPPDDDPEDRDRNPRDED